MPRQRLLLLLLPLQELGKFLVRASNLLADLHQLLIPVTVRTCRVQRHVQPPVRQTPGHMLCVRAWTGLYYAGAANSPPAVLCGVVWCVCCAVWCAVCLHPQMATAPEAIEFFMALFCNTTRIVLLMETVPWKLLVQVLYPTGVCWAQASSGGACPTHWVS